jgi:iron complex transport system permease protein
VLLQALTRNPLADPGILGISAGASLAVVLAITLLGVSGTAAYAPFALVGGAAAGVLAWALSGGGRGGTVGLALAGAAIAALCAAATQAMQVLDSQTLDQFRFWVVGSVAGGEWSTLLGAAPFLLVGAAVAAAVAPALNALSLGEDAARGLGQDVARVRIATGAAALLLAAGAVAVAGPIALVGLLAAHAARLLVGADVRWQLALAALLGVAALVGGDVVGRVVAPPREVAVGVVAPIVGVPLFLWLVARRRVRP